MQSLDGVLVKRHYFDVLFMYIRGGTAVDDFARGHLEGSAASQTAQTQGAQLAGRHSSPATHSPALKVVGHPIEEKKREEKKRREDAYPSSPIPATRSAQTATKSTSHHVIARPRQATREFSPWP